MAIQRIKVLDYRELGKKFIQWAKDADSRPRTLEEFKAQTQGIVDELPSYLKALMIVQGDKEVLLLRLPPAELVADTEQTMGSGRSGAYPLPSFYEEKLVQGLHPDNMAFFQYRVGDYTIAHCT